MMVLADASDRSPDKPTERTAERRFVEVLSVMSPSEIVGIDAGLKLDVSTSVAGGGVACAFSGWHCQHMRNEN